MNVDENIAAELTQDTDSLVGTTFADGYEMLAVLGKGGLSVVYKARYIPLDQLVAVKVLQAHMAQNQTVVQRLRLEAKVARSLDHPNIVRVLRLHISEEGYPFLVADYVDGRTMQAALAVDGPFGQERFLHIFNQVLSALEHAHTRGIVHRDIKPSNIMLTQVGDDPDFVKVVDFGIAKVLVDTSAAITQNASQSSSANIFGSPSYMSPEQGNGAGVDARSDIYSLGCVMYETLTGVTAFAGETALDILYQHAHSMPPAFRDVAPQRQIPPALENAVFAALQKQPADRPQSVEELRLLLSGKPVSYGRPSRRPVRQREILAWGAGALAAVAIAIGAFIGQKNIDRPLTTGGDESATANVRRAQTEIANLSLCTSPESAMAAGERLAKMQDTAGAFKAFEKANSLITPATDKNQALTIKNHMVDLGLELGKAQQVYPVCREAARIAESIGVFEQALTRNLVARCLHALHRDGEALIESQAACRLADEALRRHEKPLFPYHMHCGTLYGEQASYYVMMKRREQAEPLLRKSVMHEEAAGEGGKPLLLSARRALAVCLMEENKGRQALDEMHKWLEVAAGMDKTDLGLKAELSTGYETLAIALAQTGDRAGAQKALQESVAYAVLVPDGGEAMAARLSRQARLFYAFDELEKGDVARKRRLDWQSNHAISASNAQQYEESEKLERQLAAARIQAAKHGS